VAFPPLLTLILLPALMQDTVAGRTDFDERFPVELTGELSDDADGSALMEALDWLQLHPYDLNSITMEELLSIPCVTLSARRAPDDRGRGGTSVPGPRSVRVCRREILLRVRPASRRVPRPRDRRHASRSIDARLPPPGLLPARR
jgi:hypothetical protein